MLVFYGVNNKPANSGHISPEKNVHIISEKVCTSYSSVYDTPMLAFAMHYTSYLNEGVFLLCMNDHMF